VNRPDGTVVFYAPPAATEPPKPEGFQKLHNPGLVEALAPVRALEWSGRYDVADAILTAASAATTCGVLPDTTALEHAPVSIGTLRNSKKRDKRGLTEAALAALDTNRRIILADFERSAADAA
jgi:hypothetical protein